MSGDRLVEVPECPTGRCRLSITERYPTGLRIWCRDCAGELARADHPLVGEPVRENDLPQPAREMLRHLRKAMAIARDNKFPLVAGFFHSSAVHPELCGIRRMATGDVEQLQTLCEILAITVQGMMATPGGSDHVQH